MGLAIRQHILHKTTGRARIWGSLGASLAAGLAGLVFVGQIVGKWTEGGPVVLASLFILILTANMLLISPIGYRNPDQIYRIIRTKARVQGPMGAIVEWQSLRVQEYRYRLLVAITKFWALFGVRRPMRYEPPVPAGAFEAALEHEHKDESASLLDQYLDNQPSEEPHLGGAPSETGKPADQE
jgi:hypothetical protein